MPRRSASEPSSAAGLLATLESSAAGQRLASARDRVRAARRYDLGLYEGPAPLAKRRHLLRLFRERGHEIFVESGTHVGDTVAFFASHAREIVSVEIEPRLHEAAANRFAQQQHITIMRGDAVEWIPRIIGDLREGCLLWLDGHFSGRHTGRGEQDEPVLEILTRLGGLDLDKRLTIVVDDLRLFGVAAAFPSLGDLIDAARSAFPAGHFRTGLDSLVITTEGRR